MSKLTNWITGKPVREGVYETKIDVSPQTTYQHWNGEYWGCYCFNIEAAYKMNSREVPSAFQASKFRGLAAKP